MISVLRRGLLLAAVLGLGVGTWSPLGGAHCSGPTSGPAESHHADHQKDTEPAAECPHCPPAECQRHTQCSVPFDTGLAVRTTTPPAPGTAVRYPPTPGFPAAGHHEPPTPPPQLLG
ncbi:MAG: hypothetical protein ACKVZ0_15790 [Gemmatimonadales bacterium]